MIARIILGISLTVLCYQESIAFDYVPKSLLKCLQHMEAHTSDTILYDYKTKPYQGWNDYFRYPFSPGQWFGIFKWYLRLRGVWHGDDVYAILRLSLYRYLNKEPIKLSQQIKFYRCYWRRYGYGLFKQRKACNYNFDKTVSPKFTKPYKTGQLVQGFYCVIKKLEKPKYGTYTISVSYNASVIKHDFTGIQLAILQTEKEPPGYSIDTANPHPFTLFFPKVTAGDTVLFSTNRDFYLIPDY